MDAPKISWIAHACRATRRRSIEYAIAEIRRAAATGIYDIRGGGAKRKLPHFDDLLFLGASISRYPLEGYREKCGTDVAIGTRFAKQADHAQNSGDDRRHELRLALGAPPRKRSGRGATAMRHVDDDRRWRHDPGRARAFAGPWSISIFRRATA